MLLMIYLAPFSPRATEGETAVALGCFDGVNGSPGLSLWVYDAHGALLYQGDYATSLSQVYGRYETLPNGQRRVSALSPIGRSVWPDLALTLTWQS